MNDDRYTTTALTELKNNVLLLTTANEHLTDDIFLTKIGNNIGRAVEVLERDISALKKEYPGKFLNDVDTDSILEKIDKVAQRMIKPGKDIMDNHLSGALGREMESYFSSIRKAVEEIRLKVRGSHAAMADKGSVIGILSPFKAIFQSAGSILFFSIKILACLVVLVGVIFAYLFFTMEKDTVYLNEIRISSSMIKEKKDNVVKLEKEMQDLLKKRNAMQAYADDMSRTEKVEALDIEMKIKSVDSKLNQLAAEISVQERKLNDSQKKLDEFRGKPFVKKLLKQ